MRGVGLGICLVIASAGLAFAEADVPASEGELHQQVATKTPRKKLSENLVPLAKKAEKKKDWAAAIPVYQALVAARGPASPEAKQLAQIWQQAGQIEQATLAWIAYSEATKGVEHDVAMLAIQKLSTQKDPLADKLVLKPSLADARKAFAAGR
nr:hypothetical protein [Deltaproteobacteria bacterium]